MASSDNDFQNLLEKSKSKKRARVVTCIVLSVVVYILSLIHLIVFIPTASLTDGHQYGEPDKYGDYARGLYKSEATKLASNVGTLWLLLLGIIVIGSIAFFMPPGDEQYMDKDGIIKVGCPGVPGIKAARACAAAVFICAAVCVIGTLLITMVAGSYH